MKLNQSHKIVLVALLVAQNFLVAAQTTNTLAPSGFAKFIADRNIFNPNRVPGKVWVPLPPHPPLPPAPRVPDSFSLVGVIGYGEGRLAGVHAFFDGSGLQYQKEAQLNDTIANFKVAGISADSVKLVSGTNTMVLKIGEQLHDDTNGDWFFSNGTTVRYSNTGGSRFDSRYGNGRNSGRGGFGGRRRNNNFGNGGYGGYNNGNGGNFNRGRNNFRNNLDSTAATPDDSQAQDQNVTPSDGTFNPVQDNAMVPDNSGAPDGTTPPDNNQ
ncbi:MAG TPA: hypothetical protein VMV89_02310 [Candidatus Paceibacterota bacterium]|nr:hypothetical protein [Candidatus Paceibacterota bacterium]